jgi:hypothetical protein
VYGTRIKSVDDMFMAVEYQQVCCSQLNVSFNGIIPNDVVLVGQIILGVSNVVFS